LPWFNYFLESDLDFLVSAMLISLREGVTDYMY
jgi:hypothetical protein